MQRAQDFAEFPADERDDFKSILLRWRLDAGDFEVSALEDVPVAAGPIAREIAVRRRSTGKAVKFDGGNFSHWLIDFEEALRKSYFD